MKTHGEIEYTTKEGNSIHSDICPPECDFKNITPQLKQFYHEALEEWLNNSNGTGCFYLKQDSFIIE